MNGLSQHCIDALVYKIIEQNIIHSLLNDAWHLEQPD